jgi:hypothetical protein
MAERVRTKAAKAPEFDAETVRNVSIAVYKMRLEASSEGAVERMLKKDGDAGKKLSGRAQAFDTLTRCYLRAIKDVSTGYVP